MCIGYYNDHEGTIHSFFYRNTFSFELVNAFFAPRSQLHPSLQTRIPENLVFDTNNIDLNDAHDADDQELSNLYNNSDEE